MGSSSAIDSDALNPAGVEKSPPRWMRALFILFACLVLIGIGLGKPSSPIWFFCLLVIPMLIFFILKPPLSLFVPFLGLAFLTPQLGPGIYLFDFAAAALAVIALTATLRHPDREAWDVHWPGYLSVAALVVPLLAFPNSVVSAVSFLGVYKQIVVQVVLFHSLRRVVRKEDSRRLLWIFPITGLAASIQLLLKVRGFGGKVYSDLVYRNFFTSLGWGESNYIAALLVVCIGGTLLLGLLDRRRWFRFLLLMAGALMLAAFTILLSRAATIALAAFALTLLVSWGGRRSLAAAGFLAVLAGMLFATPGGQVILARFADPKEYASWYTRVLLWENAWARFLSHPWTGIGLNQGRYQSDPMGSAAAHNILLDYLMNQGILGAALLVAIGVATYRLCQSARFEGSKENRKLVRGGLLAMVTAVFVNASVEPTIDGYVVGTLFVWFLAWLTLHNQRPTGEFELGRPTPTR